MIVTFSQEEITVPKAIVVGVAEETSPSIIAANNDEAPVTKRNKRTRRNVHTVSDEAKFKANL
jgi:hypothetical protein